MVAQAKGIEKTSSKLPPHSIEAEEADFGATFIKPPATKKRGVGIFKTKSFYKPRNKKIFLTKISMFNQNKKIDCISNSV